MSEMLKAFKLVAPYIKDLMVDDVAVTITDTEKYIKFIRGEKIPQMVKAEKFLRALL
ncbi:hypothetical protein [Tepidimicrobium xylanilyticum]|uniref:hypothetical protein n=1 Tax=Tepidimicrobium xylanilyticum TaxID=1123352 RepID=UPI00264E013C|nr:hypothetical protein [Tepidimicrobium xylanilyticum]GMG95543.1 hypothetical protein EN5CB1_03690 [Tepidimicrobium xylanilyticum]